ncbi:hypothetical protein [Pseudohongiella spirulinae]|uniref:hypothetical protein n=1 Tax=Pseudohongiella spirulinae TaxID=1249552 RepID=UPI0007179FB2|nr:hypothetical protein [Pseudohongiella spirulinae]
MAGLNRAKDFAGYFSLPVFRGLCAEQGMSEHGMPATKAAYEEACRAPSPKARHRWSHPAVYQAGVATGWFELASRPTDEIYPRFEYHYEQLCKRVMAGEDITLPVPDALPEKVNVRLTREQQQARMQSLKEVVGL